MFALLERRLSQGLASLVASGRLALIGVASVLLLLSGFAVWSAWATYHATAAVSQANEITDAFSAALTATLNEESLERKYRLEPRPEVRDLHARAVADLFVALDRVWRVGSADDVLLANAVLDLHTPYLLAIRRMFDAVDAGDAKRVLQIDGDEVDPPYHKIVMMVTSAADAHHQRALLQLAQLRKVEGDAMKATPIVFALGVAAVFFFALVLRSFRQQTLRAVTSEAATMRVSELRFRSLVQNASDIVLVCSQVGFITYQSPRAETVWSVGPDALIGKPLFNLVKRGDRAALRSLFRDIDIRPTSGHKLEFELDAAGGGWQFCEIVLTNLLEQPGIHGIVATLHDVTERRAFEQELKRRAFHDPLTNLANRALFSDRLEQALMRDGERVGLLFVDLDHFKLVNDGLNHEAGDTLLVQAAERLRGCARPTDTVARIGGDEFVVLVANLMEDADAVSIAERVVDAFRKPFQLSEREIVVTASVGIAIGQAGEIQSDVLLRNADTAVYHAKASGKSRQVLFQPSMQVDDLARLQLENDLRRAIPLGELTVHYQPIVAFPSLRIDGVEALVRWQHPTRGLLAPEKFIPVAEENGLIGQLGSFVLGEACRQMAAWRARLPEAAHMTVSVNVSLRQFQNPGLIVDVKRALEQSGLPPAALILEVTESAIMRDVEPTIGKLQQLRDMGVRLAIDDFGTGYSSLAYLKRLPVQVLKIDRSFIEGIVTDQEDAAIVRAIASLGRSLDLKVTAEGIETAAQAALLEAWECDRGQGYYYARPGDAEVTEALLVSAAPFAELRHAA